MKLRKGSKIQTFQFIIHKEGVRSDFEKGKLLTEYISRFGANWNHLFGTAITYSILSLP